MEKTINYQRIINDYLKKYDITVVSWSRKNYGWAKIDGSRKVKIPHPVDEISFVVCLHEIGHVVTNPPKCTNWLAEYQAAKFVFDECRSLKIKLSQHTIDSCVNYLRYSIIKALRRRLPLQSLSDDVLDLACINRRYWLAQLSKGKKPDVVGDSGDFGAWGRCKLTWISPTK